MDDQVVGARGVLSVATRGTDGPGEVVLSIRGGTESYLARSDEPIAVGTRVLVVESHAGRTVTVVAFPDQI
jgi:hypothetical protein